MNDVTCSMTRQQAADELKIWADHLAQHVPNHPDCILGHQRRVDAMRLGIEALSEKQMIPLDQINLDVLEDLIKKARAAQPKQPITRVFHVRAKESAIAEARAAFETNVSKTPLRTPVKKNKNVLRQFNKEQNAKLKAKCGGKK